MLGHLKPNTCSLPSASQKAYKNYYCSICSSLRKQNNVSYTLFINNELTLVLLALQPFFRSQATTKKEAQTRCPALAFTKKNPISTHPAVDAAAQLSVLLGWIKVTDWAYDRPHFTKGMLRKHLDRKTHPTLEKIDPDFRQTVEDYIQITQTTTPDFEELCAQSGELSYQMVKEVGKYTTVPPKKLEVMAELFRGCGKLILLTDHLVDLTKDIQKKQYNPIISLVNNDNSSWDAAYYTIKRQFNQENYRLRSLLQYMLDNKVVHSNFGQAFKASLHQMENQILQNKPDFVADHFLFEGEEPIVVKNECCEACCECGGEGCCECGCETCAEGSCCSCGSGNCCSCEGLACCCCSGGGDAGDIDIDAGGGGNAFDGFDGDIGGGSSDMPPPIPSGGGSDMSDMAGGGSGDIGDGIDVSATDVDSDGLDFTDDNLGEDGDSFEEEHSSLRDMVDDLSSSEDFGDDGGDPNKDKKKKKEDEENPGGSLSDGSE